MRMTDTCLRDVLMRRNTFTEQQGATSSPRSTQRAARIEVTHGDGSAVRRSTMDLVDR